MIADLVTIATDPDATSSLLEDALAQARAAAEQTAADLAAAGEAYRDGLLGPEKALPKLLTAQTEAQTRRDRVAALVTRLEERHAEALIAEAEAARAEAYTAAVALRDAAAARLEAEYPHLVTQVIALLHDIAEADSAVAHANADLPAGAPRIASTERVARSLPAMPRQVLSEDIRSLWVPDGTTEPASDEVQQRVIRQRDGSGYRPSPSGTGSITYTRQHFRRVRYRPAIDAAYSAPLVDTLALPPLKPGDPLAWWPDMAAPIATCPDRTLTRIGRIIEELVADPKVQDRPVQVMHEPCERGSRAA